MTLGLNRAYMGLIRRVSTHMATAYSLYVRRRRRSAYLPISISHLIFGFCLEWKRTVTCNSLHHHFLQSSRDKDSRPDNLLYTLRTAAALVSELQASPIQAKRRSGRSKASESADHRALANRPSYVPMHAQMRLTIDSWREQEQGDGCGELRVIEKVPDVGLAAWNL